MTVLKPNDVRLVAISHGEGQFVASEKQIKQMERHGQIISQYVDLNNHPTMNMPHNPNGSNYAVEAIISPDGRIFGKMGHSERIGSNLYKNVVGIYDQKIFESGVKYFTHKK
jgi:phosphoribosylformylglycinamidine synthase